MHDAPADDTGERPLLSYEQARANRLTTDWDDHEIASPWFLGRRIVDVALADLVPFIDWTGFMAGSGLAGRYPDILDDPQHGEAARELHGRATALLDSIVENSPPAAPGVYGFWPANTDGDDIVVFENDSRRKELVRYPMLRQQEITADGQPNLSLADFIAPRDSGVPDYIGMFAVTAGVGIEPPAGSTEPGHDGREASIELLADRIAEAFAEYLHAQARRDWGYADGGQGTARDRLDGRFRGIRPSFGSSSCPDRSERFKLFAVLRAVERGITLTESASMLPAASVSGLYFSHPAARYFEVGRVGRDQLESYAGRKGVSVDALEHRHFASGGV